MTWSAAFHSTVSDGMDVAVAHGATAGTARPSTTGAVVWTGSVSPTNAVAGDRWWDTTTDPYTEKIRGSSAFSVVGSGSYVSAFKPAAYGAVGDGTTDDTTALNALIAAANAASRGALIDLGRLSYKVTAPLSAIDLTRVTVRGDGALIDCSGWASSTGALITCPATTAYEISNMQWAHQFAGVNIKGPGKSVTGNTCLSLSGADAYAHAGVGLLFTDCNFTAWNKIVNIGANSYQITFQHCSLDAAATFIDVPNVSNAGERISFIDCLFNGFSTGGVILNCANQFADVFFQNCSLDYTNQLCTVAAGRVDFQNCHMEFGNYNAGGSGAGAAPAAIIVVGSADAGADVRFMGGTLICPATTQPTTIVDCQSTIGQVLFDNVFMVNAYGSSNLFNSSSAGRVTIRNYRPANYGSLKYPMMQGAIHNAVIGTNEQTTVDDPWYVTSDGGTITGRLTSTNTNITTSTTTARTGSRSLKVASGAGTGGEATLFVPVKPGQAVDLSAWYAKPGSETGTVYVYSYWVSAALSPTGALIINKSSSINGANVTLTSSALAWTQFITSAVGNGSAPDWATHLILNVNVVSFVGNFYLDDVFISVF